MSLEEIPSPIPMRVESLEDLARFMASIAGLGQPAYALQFEYNGLNYIGVIAIYRDYYKWYGVPVFYYYESKTPLHGKYLLVRSEESGELIKTSNGVQPGWIAVPIIRLKEKPSFLKID
ncbi:MAG: cren protein [archaeon GBS-70-058]|nr:cren protein [Candidatus Culexarchaeum nevadense]